MKQVGFAVVWRTLWLKGLIQRKKKNNSSVKKRWKQAAASPSRMLRPYPSLFQQDFSNLGLNLYTCVNRKTEGMSSRAWSWWKEAKRGHLVKAQQLCSHGVSSPGLRCLPLSGPHQHPQALVATPGFPGEQWNKKWERLPSTCHQSFPWLQQARPVIQIQGSSPLPSVRQFTPGSDTGVRNICALTFSLSFPLLSFNFLFLSSLQSWPYTMLQVCSYEQHWYIINASCGNKA